MAKVLIEQSLVQMAIDYMQLTGRVLGAVLAKQLAEEGNESLANSFASVESTHGDTVDHNP